MNAAAVKPANAPRTTDQIFRFLVPSMIPSPFAICICCLSLVQNIGLRCYLMCDVVVKNIPQDL